jgi:hypothetical protein
MNVKPPPDLMTEMAKSLERLADESPRFIRVQLEGDGHFAIRPSPGSTTAPKGSSRETED